MFLKNKHTKRAIKCRIEVFKYPKSFTYTPRIYMRQTEKPFLQTHSKPT